MEELIKNKVINDGQMQERKRYIEELDRYWLKNKIITQSIIKGVIRKISGDDLYIECNDTEGLFITEKCIYENNTAKSIRNIFVKYIKGGIVLQNKAFKNNVVSGVALHIDGKDLKGILNETNESIRLEWLHIYNSGEEKTEFYIDNQIDIDCATLLNLKYIRKIVARDYIYIKDNIKTFALSSNKVTIENEKENNTIVEIINTRELYIPALEKGNIKISVIESENNNVYIDRYSKEIDNNSYDYIKSNILKISKIVPEKTTIQNIPNIKIDKFVGRKLEIYINIKNANCTDWKDIEEYKEVIRKSFIEIKTSKGYNTTLGNNMYIQYIHITIDCGDSNFKDTMFYYIKNNESFEQKYNDKMRSLEELIKEYVKVEAGENCVVTTNIIIKEKNGNKIEFGI